MWMHLQSGGTEVRVEYARSEVVVLTDGSCIFWCNCSPENVCATCTVPVFNSQTNETIAELVLLQTDGMTLTVSLYIL